jgi:hypothetical protein
MAKLGKTYEFISFTLALLAIILVCAGYNTMRFLDIGNHPAWTDESIFKGFNFYPRDIVIFLSAIGAIFGTVYSIKNRKMSMGVIINFAILIDVTIGIITGYY